MGCFDIYCCFCAGPLEDAREGWMAFLRSPSWPPKEGEWNPPGYPIPTKSIDEIVTITAEDGRVWDDWVVVAPIWPEDWVSPPASNCDSYGGIEIDETRDWNPENTNYFGIHRLCLSFLTRRLAITPQAFWESVYKPPSSTEVYFGQDDQGLLRGIDYFDMDGRPDQFFGYAILHKDSECWHDPQSMDDTSWILARPSLLPTPHLLGPSQIPRSETALPSQSCMLFGVPELFDMILDEILLCPGSTAADELMLDDEVFDPPSALVAASTLLSLSQVNRWFYHALKRQRQGAFLRAAHNFGWMLPCTPADWLEWPEELSPLSLALTQDYDWHAYLMTCLRKDDVHIRNRYRLHKDDTAFYTPLRLCLL
ncbi:hypothetical protein Moror_3320 [Moniliophthora roreri MCA 2997]|uniref:Uncharacterized protein n=2 Tax=Moniliophthora roreri TaxID=221103 RepID=V2WJD6_MONRO|nr:hypothetical protein Moror_3320 [Moniliophthora roreri MCA 2997]